MHKHDFVRLNDPISDELTTVDADYYIDTSTFDEIDEAVYKGRQIGVLRFFRQCRCGAIDEHPFLTHPIKF